MAELGFELTQSDFRACALNQEAMSLLYLNWGIQRAITPLQEVDRERLSLCFISRHNPP